MEKRICEICHTATEDTFLTVGEQENVCMECATKMALEAKAENREIEITDEQGNAWCLCTWCEELYPKANSGRKSTSATSATTASWRSAHGANA